MADPSTVNRAGIADGARDFQLTGHIESPTSAKAYVLDLSTYFQYEIISATVAGVDGSSSTGDIEFLRNGTGIPGLNFTGVIFDDGTDEKDQDATGTVTMTVGQQLTLVSDNFSGAAPDDLFFTVLCREKKEIA